MGLAAASTRGSRRLGHAVALVALAVGLGAAATPAGSAEAPFTIEREAGELVVEANQADVEDLVVGLGEQLGFDVRVLTGVERPPVSGTISGPNASEILKKVLRDRNYALVYEEAADRQELSEVLLLSPPPDQRWVPPAEVSQERTDRRRQVRAELLKKRRERARRRRAARQR